MIFVTGGAYQGKTDFAVSSLGIDRNDILDCCSDEIDFQNYSKKGICNFQYFVKKLVETGYDQDVILGFAEKAAERYDVIISTEIGCGIVPVDKNERVWREMTGRSCSLIAAKAEKVYRVICGMPQCIKGE